MAICVYIGTLLWLDRASAFGSNLPVDIDTMRSTYLSLSVAVPLASVFVIPDERMDDRLSKAGGEIKGISPDEHRG